MPDLDFNEIVSLICKEDARFDRKAYSFIREGLDFAVKDLKKREAERSRQSLHVSGAELLVGIRTFALEQYGPLAITVLNSFASLMRNPAITTRPSFARTASAPDLSN